MVEVYSAANYPEAGAIQALLDEHGINSELRGGDLNPLAGEIPFGEAQPTLWVAEDDFQKARGIIEGQDEPGVDSIPARPSFASDSRSASTSRAQHDDSTARNRSSTGASGESSWLWKAAAVLFFGTTVLLGFMSNRNRIAEESGDGEWRTVFHYGRFEEKTGCEIERWIETKLMSAKYCDSNGDGVPDSIFYYGAREKLVTVIHDRDTDGVYEIINEYDRNGNLRLRLEDADQDGFAERKTEFRDGVEVQYLDKNGDRFFDPGEKLNAGR